MSRDWLPNSSQQPEPATYTRLAFGGRGDCTMKYASVVVLAILALSVVAQGADRVVHYEHFTAVW